MSEAAPKYTVFDAPIEALVIGKSNMRKDHDTDPALAHSIAAAGLMYPLTVKTNADGQLEIIDGARRFLAIKYAIAQGLMAETTIPVQALVNGLDSLEYSVHSNLHMAAHPLDEADAIAQLAKNEDKAQIAKRFGKSVLWVDQRARLSLLIADVKQLFRGREIDLETAMAFTLGDEKLQRQVVKAHAYNSPAQVKRMMTTGKVNAKEAIFPLDQWPDNKIERDLFSDEVWLTSIPLFLKMQGDAFAGLAEEYRVKGYNDVRVLKSGDWETVNRYTHVEGKVSPKNIGNLTVLLQLGDDGKVRRWENMIPNKEAKKVTRSAAGPDKTSEEEIKPKKAKDFSNMQLEQMAAQAVSALFMQIVEGSPPDSLIQYIVWSAVTRSQTEKWAPSRTIGADTERRRVSVAANHKVPHGVAQTQTPDGMSYAKWMSERTAAARKTLFLEAVARLLHYPHPLEAMDALKTIPVKGWFKPDEQFLGRYRSDQLQDYIRKSGLSSKSWEGLNKAELVKMALGVSKKDSAWSPW